MGADIHSGRPVLYLMVGYPGAGKTTVAKMIHEATGAVHMWSDIERHKMFGLPTHSEEESIRLYDELNRRTDELLAQGKSVIFDTNFNFREDRRKLREIAGHRGAETLIIWVILPVEEARKRSLGSGRRRNGYHSRMTEEHFDQIVSKLEPPEDDENVIKIDGTKLDRETVLALIGQDHGAKITIYEL